MKKEQLMNALRELDVRLTFMLKEMMQISNRDPKVFAMNEAMFDVAHLLSEDNKSNNGISELGKSIEDKFNKYMISSLPRLVSKEKGLYAFELASYFTEKLDEMHGYNSLGDETMKKTMNVVCSANMDVHRGIRNIKRSRDYHFFVYCNEDEYRRIGLLCEITDLSGASQRLVDEIDDAYVNNLEEFNWYRQIRKGREKVRRP